MVCVDNNRTVTVGINWSPWENLCSPNCQIPIQIYLNCYTLPFILSFPHWLYAIKILSETYFLYTGRLSVDWITTCRVNPGNFRRKLSGLVTILLGCWCTWRPNKVCGSTLNINHSQEKKNVSGQTFQIVAPKTVIEFPRTNINRVTIFGKITLYNPRPR